MFVDGGAAVNVMPYTMFRKLGMGPGDLTPTSVVLNDFAGNPLDTKGCVHVDLMIGSKTLLTTFFVIEGKGAYSLLLGRDWILQIAASHLPCINNLFNGWMMM
jgi:hypothetical protein